MIETDIRPISLTPIACTVFESIVLKGIDKIVKPQMDPIQFGSIPGTSVTDAAVEMVHRCYQATDIPGTYVRILLIDFF